MTKTLLLGATALRSVAGIAAAIVFSVPALAQQTQVDTKTAQATAGEDPACADPKIAVKPANCEAIVVTGSRIRSPNLKSSLPVTSIRGTEFFETGNVSIGDTLADLPSLRSTFTQANSTRFLGTSGLNLLDLRGLDPVRTLVLINGRRQVGGDVLNSGVALDTNTIPTDLIERVDIVTGGNSAVYGSDAIAGVVNFVLKDHYNGFQVRAQGGMSKYSDAGSYFISGLAGKNFAGGRGNIALNVEYARQNQYFGAKRDFVNTESGFIQVDQDQNGIPDNQFFRDIRNAAYTNEGAVRFGGGDLVANPLNCGIDPSGTTGYNCPFRFNKDGTLTPITGQRVGFGPTGSFIGGNGFSFQSGNQVQLSPSLDRYNVNLVAHFEISPAVVPFIEAKYARSRAVGTGGSGPAFTNGAVFNDPAPGQGYVNRERIAFDNPYLTQQARDVITAQRALNGQTTTNATRISVRENLQGLGARTEDSLRQTYRIVAGVKGDLGNDFNYEVAINYSRLNEKTKILGNLNVQRYLLANDAVFDAASNKIVCRSQVNPAAAIGYVDNGNPTKEGQILAADIAACTPINIIGGQFTDAQRAYVLQNTIATGRTSQFDASGFIGGNTDKFFRLPGGPIGFVVGAEYRADSVAYTQDSLVSEGYTFYNPIPSLRAPKNKVTEAFAEIRIPILKDRPFFNILEVDAAGRVSHYSLAKTGTVKTYNLTALWAPTSELRFRGNIARAVRAPNQVDLFSPAGQNYTSFDDPCSAENLGQGTSTRAANCATQVPAGYVADPANSLPFLSGGNPNLQAEKSDSYTIGGVLTPKQLPGLSITVDYYHIAVKKTISSVGAQTIIDQCVDLPTTTNPYCPLFKRAGPGGGPNGELPGEIIQNSLTAGPLNFAKLVANGIDAEIAYRHQVGKLGLLDSRFTYTHVTKRSQYLDPTRPNYEDRVLTELGDPQDSFNWNSSLQHGRLTFGYQMRYISKMVIDTAENIYSVQGRPPENPEAYSPAFYPHRFYHDVRLAFDLTKKVNFYAGVDNLTNTKPPLGLTGIGGGGAIYDNRGQFFYAGLVAKY